MKDIQNEQKTSEAISNASQSCITRSLCEHYNTQTVHNSRNGTWISPSGRIYPIGDGGHGRRAREIIEGCFGNVSDNPEEYLESSGWIKTIGARRQISNKILSMNGFITKRQADALFDLGLYDTKEAKTLIADSEMSW